MNSPFPQIQEHNKIDLPEILTQMALGFWKMPDPRVNESELDRLIRIMTDLKGDESNELDLDMMFDNFANMKLDNKD